MDNLEWKNTIFEIKKSLSGFIEDWTQYKTRLVKWKTGE